MFKAAAERRTVGRTGILIYLSMGERRAEIVADEAILAVTDEHTWGEAMEALLVEVRAGRPGDGMVAAIGKVGEVLQAAFPALRRRHQRNPRQAHRTMSGEDDGPPQVMWEGKYVRALKRGRWEYVEPRRRRPRGGHPRRHMRAR